MSPRRWAVILVLVATIGAACGGSSDDPAENSQADPTSTASQPSAGEDTEEAEDTAAQDEGSGSAPAGSEPESGSAPESESDESADASAPTVTEEVVRFATSDGEELEGTLFGAAESEGGDGGMVLAHMRGRDRSTWLEFARDAAATGLRVLTFDFRGYGGSSGVADTNLDIDLTSAIGFLRSQGPSDVVVMGASMGGTATVNVASTMNLAGAASLSAPAEFLGLPALTVVDQVSEPLLLVAAENDEPYASAAVALDAGASVSQLQIFDGNSHGTNLFGDHGAELTALLLAFTAEMVN